LVGKGKTVVLVAGGEGDKAEAIHTCLAAKIVNALVTDATTMERLLSVAPTKQTLGLRSDYWEI
jgi:DNA-binding transcriptional regulator LsrR (DeoR family)